MSLPDTVFIFVLALIIFGPKKLPEIGRQLGRLVGEFRRASNEFKFQIEEELRQVELTDRQIISAHNNEPEPSISSPSSDSTSTDLAITPDVSTPADQTYAEETLPVGQHPNMDNQDPYELNALNQKLAESESVGDYKENEVLADTPPTIRAAAGSQPRTTLPYASAEPVASTPAETVAVASGETESIAETPTASASVPPAVNATAVSGHEPADSYVASTVADITHG